MRPRAWTAMKLMASGVTNWAAMVRSPSFSRSSSSTTTSIRPPRISSIACGMVAKDIRFQDSAGVVSELPKKRDQSVTHFGGVFVVALEFLS